MSDVKHTPTPWYWRFNGTGGNWVLEGPAGQVRLGGPPDIDPYAGDMGFIVTAVNSHARLIEALEKSAEGWANAIEMGLIPPKHVTSATILRDEARKALAQAREDGQ